MTEARGDGHLEAVTLTDRDSGTDEDVAVNWLFVFIGASPHTDWLGAEVARDAKGFVVTGQDLLALSPTAWTSPDLRSRSRPASPASSLRGTSGWTP